MERLPGLNAIISSLIHTQDGPCRPFTATSSNFIHFTEKSYILPLPFFQIIQGYLTFDSKKDGISHSEMGGTLVAADSSINPMLPFNNLHSVFTRSNFHLKKPLSSHITRVTPKDARIEGHGLIFSWRTPKLQLAAEQQSTGECWIPPKNGTVWPRADEKPQQDGRRGKITF